MMAKMFYTLDEAKEALGKSEEEIKQLVHERGLREFRDGTRLMFKADQVEQFKNELGGGGQVPDQVDLGPSDSGAPIGLVDSRNASGSVVTLSDTDAASGTGVDLGLSGSQGGMPSPSHLDSGLGSGLSGSGLGNVSGGSGVTVFRPDEIDERVDPMAQTAMSGSLQDQINLEGVGSGSGLLDLTREGDDTSLGAELLDDISSGGSHAAAPVIAASDTGSGSVIGAPSSGVAMGNVISSPIYVEAADSMAPALAGAALGAALIVLFGGFIVTGAVLGFYPSVLESVASNGVWAIFGGGLVVSIILFVIGMIAGKSAGK